MLRAHSSNVKTTCSHLNAWNVVQWPNNMYKHTGFGPIPLKRPAVMLDKLR